MFTHDDFNCLNILIFEDKVVKIIDQDKLKLWTSRGAQMTPAVEKALAA